jgi:hypothetical protein
MADQDEPIYKFTPQFEGAFLRHVPQRDLTQADVDHMTPDLVRDAFSPHPLYGKPLYTAVEGKEAKAQERVIAAFDKAEAKAAKEGDA